MSFQAHGAELVAESEVDVLQGVIASIDGEKDPRCLMLSFQLAQQVICIYEQAAPQVQPSCPQELNTASHAYMHVSHSTISYCFPGQRPVAMHTAAPGAVCLNRSTLHTICCCVCDVPAQPAFARYYEYKCHRKAVQCNLTSQVHSISI